VIVVPFGADKFVNDAISPKQTDAGAENDAIGAAFTVIIFVCVDVEVHPVFDAVSVTEYVPGVV